MLYLVAIGWIYVVLMMAGAEALAPGGSVLGALLIVVFYGLLPLAVLLFILGTPARRRALRAKQAREWQARSALDPDGRGHAAGDAVAAKREEA